MSNVIGTTEEAKEIFQAVGEDKSEPPEGWEFVGQGGTRRAFKSPTGVVYKICYSYDDDQPSVNDREHANFKRILEKKKLPRGWRVPKNHLHVFEANVEKWNNKLQKEVKARGRVAVLAVEYVEGKAYGSWEEHTTDAEFKDFERAFFAVGLSDTFGANAIRAINGNRYIIDAGEFMFDNEEPNS